MAMRIQSQEEQFPQAFPDFSDVIHTDPKTWGGPNAAATSRPWHRDSGVGDDDPAFPTDPRTNREWEARLEELRAAGGSVHMRNRMGEQRHPGSYRVPMGGGMVGVNGQQEADARRINKGIRQREKEEYLSMYPNGCPHCGKG
jgi:hypothetical protein